MIPGIRYQLSSVFALLLFFAGSAFADPITGPFLEGEIAFAGESGSATPTGGTGIEDATGIDFDNSKDIIVFGTSGDFDVIPNYTSASFFDFVFSPSAPADPLWEVVYNDIVYKFSVDLFTVVTQTSSMLSIEGTGYLAANGYSDTAGNWTFSLDQSGSTLFGWSSTTATVPEPGTLGLLGLGLLGLGLRRRRA